MVEKSIESGQPLPKEYLQTNMEMDTKRKGVKNICLGFGLFIFLWAITNFGIGCIGILVMCVGLGQYLTASDKDRNKDNK